jgi:hypothetical protein
VLALLVTALRAAFNYPNSELPCCGYKFLVYHFRLGWIGGGEALEGDKKRQTDYRNGKIKRRILRAIAPNLPASPVHFCVLGEKSNVRYRRSIRVSAVNVRVVVMRKGCKNKHPDPATRSLSPNIVCGQRFSFRFVVNSSYF